MGNIGAHFEADINVIVDVDPGEANLLILLIEDLFAEWYVAKHNKLDRISNLLQVSKEKQTQKKAPPTS